MSLLWTIRNQHLLLLLIAQLVTSLLFIYYCKNKISYVTEIILVIGNIFYNKLNLEIETVLCYVMEDASMKVLLVLIVWLAKQFAFSFMVVMSHKRKNA